MFTFTRFKYLVDFSGFEQLSLFQFAEIDFRSEGDASGIMLPQTAVSFAITDCHFTRPKDRGVTSIGSGCQGMLIDRCQFLSNEQALKVEDRTTIGFNANANDVKVRDNRTVLFKHFCVLGGTGSVIVGNHWFHGDEETDGVRGGGIIFTSRNVKTLITGNYIDNNFLEWTNEHESSPDNTGGFSFGGMTITGNVFTCSNTADWFNWIVIKPYGEGQFVNGRHVVGNVFKSLNGSIDRIENVDTTFADLNYGLMVNIEFRANTFNSISNPVSNPALIRHTEASPDNNWLIETQPNLPFLARARTVESVVATSEIVDSSGDRVWDMPFTTRNQGPDKSKIKLTWSRAVEGSVVMQVRMDNPV